MRLAATIKHIEWKYSKKKIENDEKKKSYTFASLNSMCLM